MDYLYFFTISTLLSVIFTLLVKKIALRFNIVDDPSVSTRKIHKKSVPLLGGIAIFLSFFVCLFFSRDLLVSGNLNVKHWLGFFTGALFLMIGGFIDDKYRVSAKYQLVWPILAVLSVIIGGVSIDRITNPMGGIIDLGVISGFIVFAWLMGMMYTTKLLDGVDGLVSGVAVIGSLIVFLFTLTTKYYQPDIAMASLILAGSAFGFLLFNWHPAKIFIGEGGSLFVGYALGVLAIISGGKIAITLLFMGIPILDLFWTVIRRIISRKNLSEDDKEHLHYKLLALGLGQRKTVLLYYIMAIVFGLSGLFLQSLGKILALVFLFVIMIFVVLFLNKKK